MTNTPQHTPDIAFSDELDRVLTQYGRRYSNRSMHLDEEDYTGSEHAKAQIISAVEAMVNEVIGHGNDDSPHNMDAHLEREILRLEQRKRLAQKLHGVKK